jgi:RNA polymerase sigma-70 factor (ECF subfamily)
VLAAQDGQRDAFAELARRFERMIYGLALRRLRNHAEAQETVQEVFVTLLRKLGQLRDPASLPGWLRQIAMRHVSNRLSRRGPLATSSDAVDATESAIDSPLTSALAHERRKQVRAGLARLGRLDRQTLEAFYVNGQSLVEMSASFASPVGTIKRRLHVARKRLARELEGVIDAN